MKKMFLYTIHFLFCLNLIAQNYDLQVVAELDLGVPLGQLRAVPVNLGEGKPKGIAAMYSEDAEIDPYIGGLSAMASQFTSLPGEQILSYSKNGILRIWADKNAKDTERAKSRYKNPFYKVNQKQTGNGYNLFTLGGI